MKTGLRTYLDCNATHPLLPEARMAVVDALDIFANPSSVHTEGRKARSIIDAARRNVAGLIHAKAEHVVFTSGATEAANLVLSPSWQMGRASLAVKRLYVSATEHRAISAGGRFAVDQIALIPVAGTGELKLDHLVVMLEAHDNADGPPLVAVQHANNETGVVQPIAAIAAIVKSFGGIFIVDAVQTYGRIPIDITKDCGDFFIVSSHKIGGPKGAGALIGVTDLMMPRALVRGGGQEKGYRAGTEALPMIAGFGAAALAAKDRSERGRELEAKRDAIVAIVVKTAPDAIIHGARAAERLPNTVFFTIPGIKAETAQIGFDLSGVALSSGSACSSGKVGPSQVLKAMDVEAREGALRVSICLETSDAEIEHFQMALEKHIANRRT